MARFELMYGHVNDQDYYRARRELVDFTQVAPDDCVDPASLDRFAAYVGPNLARLISVNGEFRSNTNPHLKLPGIQATYDGRNSAIILAREAAQSNTSSGSLLQDYASVPLSWKTAQPTDAILTSFDPSKIVPETIYPLKPRVETDIPRYVHTLQQGVSQILSHLPPVKDSEAPIWEGL